MYMFIKLEFTGPSGPAIAIPVQHIYKLYYFSKLFVQLGPGLKSETKALDQSRTLNSLWTTHHPPPTTITY